MKNTIACTTCCETDMLYQDVCTNCGAKRKPCAREQKFSSFKDHAWLRKVYAKLQKNEVELSLKIIRENRHLNKGDFELMINRYFLHKQDKPKNWTVISELLCCANTGAEQ